jgi:hypothetical protein
MDLIYCGRMLILTEMAGPIMKAIVTMLIRPYIPVPDVLNAEGLVRSRLGLM